jgi:hypothetical protein
MKFQAKNGMDYITNGLGKTLATSSMILCRPIIIQRPRKLLGEYECTFIWAQPPFWYSGKMDFLYLEKKLASFMGIEC